MEGDEGGHAKAEVKLTPAQEADYSAMTLGFVVGVAISVVAAVALVVTRV